MLEINNIEVAYDKVIVALRGISIFIPESKIVALLGGNGAGKTTTIKAILGLLEDEEGEIENGSISFFDQRIDRLDTDDIIKMGIALVPEGRRLFSNMTVEQNLKVGAHTRRYSKSEIQDKMDYVFDLFPLIATHKNRIAGYLSGGEQQMVALGRGLMTDPRLIIFDEPSLGLAPLITMDIFETIVKINRTKQIAILIVEQNANIALNIADYAYILENGKVVMDGESERLRNNEDVREFYLGIAGEGSNRKSYADVKHYKRRKRWLS